MKAAAIFIEALILILQALVDSSVNRLFHFFSIFLQLPIFVSARQFPGVLDQAFNEDVDQQGFGNRWKKSLFQRINYK